MIGHYHTTTQSLLKNKKRRPCWSFVAVWQRPSHKTELPLRATRLPHQSSNLLLPTSSSIFHHEGRLHSRHLLGSLCCCDCGNALQHARCGKKTNISLCFWCDAIMTASLNAPLTPCLSRRSRQYVTGTKLSGPTRAYLQARNRYCTSAWYCSAWYMAASYGAACYGAA